MRLVVGEYPTSQRRRVVRWWCAVIVVAAVVSGGLLMVSQGSLPEDANTALLAGCLMLALFPLPVVIWIAVLETVTPRVVAVFETPLSEEGSPRGRIALRGGKAVARSYQTLSRLAREHSFAALSDFGEGRVQTSSATYFDPQDGVRAVEMLMQTISTQPTAVTSHGEVVDDLGQFLETLREAAQQRVRFRFAVSVR